MRHIRLVSNKELVLLTTLAPNSDADCKGCYLDDHDLQIPCHCSIDPDRTNEDQIWIKLCPKE